MAASFTPSDPQDLRNRVVRLIKEGKYQNTSQFFVQNEINANTRYNFLRGIPASKELVDKLELAVGKIPIEESDKEFQYEASIQVIDHSKPKALRRSKKLKAKTQSDLFLQTLIYLNRLKVDN